MASLPDIAIINFSSVQDDEVQRVIRSINRQIIEDFMPIWGSGYTCKLHAAGFDAAHPNTLQKERVPAEAVIYLVDQPHIAGALGYHDLNASEVPVGFVFTDLGPWTVTLSHEVLELIVDPTVNIFVPGPDPRDPVNSWLFHTYEVCDAVERSEYFIDDVAVSNFVTPQYFSDGDSPGTRNDFLGVGVDSFGVTTGSHLGTVDPITFDWVVILGREAPNTRAHAVRTKQFTAKAERARPCAKLSSELDGILSDYQSCPAEGCKGLPSLRAITRTSRYQAAAKRLRQHQNSLQN